MNILFDIFDLNQIKIKYRDKTILISNYYKTFYTYIDSTKCSYTSFNTTEELDKLLHESLL